MQNARIILYSLSYILSTASTSYIPNGIDFMVMVFVYGAWKSSRKMPDVIRNDLST